jgi:predicted anti-sigma-YlaC factor YlaD
MGSESAARKLIPWRISNGRRMRRKEETTSDPQIFHKDLPKNISQKKKSQHQLHNL